jgi:putative membrane protein
MTLRWLVASFHLAALVIGATAIFLRARSLNRLPDAAALRSALAADNWWGVAAALWLITGLWRAFGGLEKGAQYYLHNPLFHAKLGLFILVLLLELWPMITLIRWRIALRRSQNVTFDRAPLFAKISYVELGLVAVIVFLATALARGIGA